MLKNLPGAWNISIQSADKQTTPAFASREASGLRSAMPAKSDTVGSAKTGPVANQAGGNERIRLDQVRLKQAGFDPGPIDGILGPKTKAAKQRYLTSLRGKTSTHPSKVGLSPER
jgi:peptidoglycan hydrolase-like protein with peptidoglycan-binding domain